MTGKITCQICGSLEHTIQLHIRDAHPDWTIERYRAEFPDAPVLSDLAKAKLAKKKAGARVETATVVSLAEARPTAPIKRPFHQVFELGEVKAAMNARGGPIMVSTFDAHDYPEMVPDVDKAYIFDIEWIKDVVLACELNIPMLTWGFHGTGKTTLIEQGHARLRRSLIRVQHTMNTEESHIVGQTLAKDGSTYFEPGPLPLAMRNGWSYLADEYDNAMPGVTSVYQPVLEGKPLLIKEAPPEWRLVRPHPNFRFFATANTPGTGDETGLYQGTNLGNAANYSRFGITVEIGYMRPKIEAAVVAAQARIEIVDAEKLVDFANRVRGEYKAGRISMTVSPRELINGAVLGLAKGGQWREGLRRAFINRLTRADREAVEQMAQRIFG